MRGQRASSWAERAYAALLALYPGSFREEYGGEMSAAFADRWAEVRGRGSRFEAIRLALAVGLDTLATALAEHRHLIAQDLRQAWRTLLLPRNRSFTIASGITLAVGIGGATVIYSIAHAVLLAPLPYRDAGRVVYVASTNLSRDIPDFSVSVPDFLSWQEHAESFAGLAALKEVGANVSGGAERNSPADAERVYALAASANLFDVLGLPLVAGRSFAAGEDVPGGARVAIVGEGLWRRRYGADPVLLGRSIRVDGEPRTVVGIAPRDAGFSTDVDLWLPLAPDPATQARGDRRLVVLGRLAPGATAAGALAEVDAIAARLEREFPDSNLGWRARIETARDWIVGPELRTRLLVLLAAVGVLLLVACANVASLQVARATARMREIGVRLALGASPARVVRHLMTESLVLGALGGGLGLALAWAAIEGAAAVLPASVPRLSALALNGPVAGVAVLVTVLTAVGFGLLPSLLAGRADVLGAVRQGGRSGVEAGRTPVREALVAIQLALATLLVIGAALLAQSFVRLQSTPLGFQPDRLLTARLSLPQANGEEYPEKNLLLYNALLDEARALPGVVSAGLTSEIPLGVADTSMAVSPRPNPPGETADEVQASWRIVTSDYLRTLGIPLRRGRLFGRDEPRQSILLSEGLARRLWPGGSDPVGRPVWLGNGQEFTVVGTVGDVRQLGLAQDVTPTMYFPTSWYLWPTMSLVLRTSGDPAALAGPLRQAAARLSPDHPLFDIQTMTSVISASVAEPRLQTLVVAAFAGLSLLLAAVGVAGVVAYAVARRTPELAVRAALGASPGQVVRHVLGRGLALCLAGVALGALLAAAFGAGLEDLLYGIRADSPATYAATALALLAVGLLACWLPARRATRIDPNLALRAE